ncbi:MAG TPA: MarR family transcriptional regulator [Solirubrobacteraceae bacterium]|nr:MarR family transcriptional regulator [Solirubrobacteraceae bacterium]
MESKQPRPRKKPPGDPTGPERAQTIRGRQRNIQQIRESLRRLRIQLSLLNYRVGAQLDLRDVDLDCFDIIDAYGPLSPSALARRAGLHPATMTGVLDRLERGGWIARERDPSDRRAVLVRADRERYAELMRRYAPMSRAMNKLVADYTDGELATIADFLTRTVDAGKAATDELATSE